MRLHRVVPLVLLLFGVAQVRGQDDIDFKKAQEIRQRALKGEKLSKEEKAYLEKVIQAKRKGAKLPDKEEKSSTGLKPLTDMSADEKYKGEEGGLYGGGKNVPPKAHLEAALRRAKSIQPLNAEGKPDKDGKIVLISLGMSNTTQAFSAFMKLADVDKDKSPRVVIVDGAQGGMDARAWSQPAKINPKGGRTEPWTFLEQRLKQADATPEQVQVVWIKHALISPASLGEHPRHTDELKGQIQVILHKLTERFPNLQIAYLSSRTYAGYAGGRQLNPEPYAYESAFAVRQLIQEQIRGEPRLNHDPEKGAVKAPLLLWGPYLWTDGEKGRKFDDLTYKREDYAGDGTHQSMSGRQKVGEQLLRFLKSDPTARDWFTK